MKTRYKIRYKIGDIFITDSGQIYRVDAYLIRNNNKLYENMHTKRCLNYYLCSVFSTTYHKFKTMDYRIGIRSRSELESKSILIDNLMVDAL